MSTEVNLKKEVEKRVEETMNYMGMAGVVGLTEQARKNIKDWLVTLYTLFYRMGDRDGFREGSEDILKQWNKSLDVK